MFERSRSSSLCDGPKFNSHLFGHSAYEYGMQRQPPSSVGRSRDPRPSWKGEETRRARRRNLLKPQHAEKNLINFRRCQECLPLASSPSPSSVMTCNRAKEATAYSADDDDEDNDAWNEMSDDLLRPISVICSPPKTIRAKEQPQTGQGADLRRVKRCQLGR